MNGSSERLPTPFDDGEVYDLVLKDLPYGFDFYTGLAREAKGPVLDVCCGTGRILLPCLQAGVDIEGLDYLADLCEMLDTLRQKADELGLSPRLHQADMSDFDLPRHYALVMIPFNAVGHNMTQEAQIRCLSLCRQHLMPGGLLAFDTFFPSLAIIGTPQHTRVLEAEMPHPATGLPMRMYDTRSFDRVAQVAAFHQRTGIAGHRWQRAAGSSFRDEPALHLQTRNGAAAAGRRVFAFCRIHGDFVRNRRPLTRRRPNRYDCRGVEGVSRCQELTRTAKLARHPRLARATSKRRGGGR